MAKYDIKGPWYKIALAGIYVGFGLISFGGLELQDGRNGLEEVVAGLLITGASFHYRFKCRQKEFGNKNPNI